MPTLPAGAERGSVVIVWSRDALPQALAASGVGDEFDLLPPRLIPKRSPGSSLDFAAVIGSLHASVELPDPRAVIQVL